MPLVEALAPKGFEALSEARPLLHTLVAIEADEAAPIWLNHYQYKSRAEWDAKVRERENVPSLRGTFPL